MRSKAAGHSVTPSPEGFVVVSGASGRSYLVAPLAMGGAHCNCAHGRNSSAIASRCSHVAAVEAFAATVLAQRPAGSVACWLCGGTGQIEVGGAAQDRRSSRVIDEPTRTETCMACGGRGWTPKGE